MEKGPSSRTSTDPLADAAVDADAHHEKASLRQVDFSLRSLPPDAATALPSPGSRPRPMAAGSVRARAWRLLPSYYFLTVVVVASGGIPKGYDEGGFAAASGLESFLHDFHLSDEEWTGTSSQLASRRALISSLGVLGAAVGAAVALAVMDSFGRLRTWQAFCILWLSGFAATTFASGSLDFLLVSRVWAGIGAGGLTVVAPLYLSEIAKAKARGMIVSIFMVFLLSSLMIGFFINYAAHKTMAPTREQYRIVLAVPMICVAIVLITSVFLRDSPRWLASKDRPEDALAALAKLRGAPEDDAEVVEEFDEILQQVRDQKQVLAGTSIWTITREVATIPTYRQRFLLGLAMQTIAQWSGGNGITYWIPDILRLAGIADHNNSLIASGGYGAVKLVFTMIFTWGLIDVFGRRRCFMAGLSIQCASHVYMAIYMALWRGGENKAASNAAIASVFIYAIGWSIGLCTVQYLYSSEILPTRVRGVCYSANMTMHWLFQFAVVRVTPSMFTSLGIWGAYVFWAAVCAVGLVLLGLWAPETKGVSMERMEELFDGPWYMGWRARPAADRRRNSVPPPPERRSSALSSAGKVRM